MKSKIIGVTGGTGYVGSRTVNELRKRGHTVVAIDIVTPEERDLVFEEGVTFRHHDLRIPSEAKTALKDINIVMQLAADIGSLTYMHDHMAEILVNNAQIDSALYPAMIENKVEHVIYSSSSMVFQHPPKFPYVESDLDKITPPSNVYGFSKLAGEYYCRSFLKQYGLPYTIIRYHNIYGAGEDSKGATPGDIHVIPALLEKVIVKKQYPIELIGDPQATRPFTYVDDSIEATVKIIELSIDGAKTVLNEDYNIGNDVYYTIEKLAEIIWEKFGDGRPFKYKSVGTKAVTALRREVDITKIKNNIGWEPKTTLETGLEPTAQWIRSR